MGFALFYLAPPNRGTVSAVDGTACDVSMKGDGRCLFQYCSLLGKGWERYQEQGLTSVTEVGTVLSVSLTSLALRSGYTWIVHYQPKDALLSDKGPETMDLPVLLNRHWPLWVKLWVNRVLFYTPCGQHGLWLATSWVTLSIRDLEPGQEKNWLWFCILGSRPWNLVQAWRLILLQPTDVILGLAL